MIAAAVLSAGLDRTEPGGVSPDRLEALIGVLAVAGLLFVSAVLLVVRWSQGVEAAGRGRFKLVVLIGVVFLGMRLPWLFVPPMLEDDHFRYLWDGRVVLAGEDPYAVAPAEVLRGLNQERLSTREGALWDAAREPGARATLERINHPEVRTIYPPVAELAFAVAQTITPYRPLGLRLLFMACEAVAVWGLWVALRRLGRSPGWVTACAWNPLLAWSLIGSSHMDALILPCLAWALAAAARGGVIGASGLLAVAAGVKLWPAMLAPLLWRSFWKTPVRTAFGALVFTAMTVVFVVPPIAAIDKPTGGEDAGLAAYAERWRFNDALFSLFYDHYEREIGDTDKLQPKVKSASRRAVAVTMFCVLGACLLLPGVWPRPRKAAKGDAMAVRGVESARQRAGLAVSRRWTIATAALFMLSPTQLPWYAVWMAPMLVVTPSVGLWVYAATLPLYYLWLHPDPPWGLTPEASPWVQSGVVWGVLAVEGFVLMAWAVWAWMRRERDEA
ncbi:MAG: hypothetical protein AAGA57_00830 [Planctomycetota bacterium]